MKGQSKSNTDDKLLNSFHVPENEALDAYAMAPIAKNSLIIKNGVMYVLGGISSGKSTLLSKMAAAYKKQIDPIILYFYSGLSADETTTFAFSSFGIKPHYIHLPTPESMVSFFNHYRYKRLKLAELLMFLASVYKANTPLLLATLELIQELELTKHVDVRGTHAIPHSPQGGIIGAHSELNEKKRFHILLSYIYGLVEQGKINTQPTRKQFIYLSEFLLKNYSKRRRVKFEVEPELFITHALISFAKGLKPQTITVDILNEPGVKPNLSRANILNRFVPYNFPPFIRLTKAAGIEQGKKIRLELVPSVSIFDDIASFPLLTTERAGQWVKDLLAETRRQQNTFIFSAQRYNLLNKTLRSLTHTFFIGYGLIDDDLPKIAKEFPSNLLSSKEFMLLYQNVIKPFTFIVYNVKLGFNVLELKR